MAFLKLFHGRASPDEQLTNWGEDGPIFGPYPYFHHTYLADIKFDEEECHELVIVEGLVFYDGMYYGDWSIFDGPPQGSDAALVTNFVPELCRHS